MCPTTTAGFYDTEIAYDGNSNPTSTKDLVRGNMETTLRRRDVLYTFDVLNRVTGAEQGHLSSGTISYPNRNEVWNDLTLTGNWENRRLDANGDGDFSDEADRDELSANTTFNEANEWTARRVSKTSNDPTNNWDDWTYDYNDNGQQIREQLSSKRVTGLGTVQTLGARLFRYDAFGRLTGVYADYMEEETPISIIHSSLAGVFLYWAQAEFFRTVSLIAALDSHGRSAARCLR